MSFVKDLHCCSTPALTNPHNAVYLGNKESISGACIIDRDHNDEWLNQSILDNDHEALFVSQWPRMINHWPPPPSLMIDWNNARLKPINIGCCTYGSVGLNKHAKYGLSVQFGNVSCWLSARMIEWVLK